MLDELQVAEVLLTYCKELTEKYKNDEFDKDRIMIIGLICGLLSSLGKKDFLEDIQRGDVLGYTINVINEIVENNSSDKPTKKITKERFLYLKENICILDEMVHHKKECKTIIMDDAMLTNEITILSDAVEHFEEATGLKIEIH